MVGSPRKATSVAAMETGLTTGAASMKASPAPGGTPLANSRRVRNTTPHSQHGVAAPRARPNSVAGKRPLGR